MLRPKTFRDVDAHLAGDDKLQVKWLSGGPSTRETVTAWIERNQRYWKLGGPIFNLGIEEQESRRLVGMIEANLDPNDSEGVEPGEANISYSLYPDARGKGYASRAVNLMTDFLAGQEVRACVIRVHPDNVASHRVAERSGFRRTGTVQTKNEGTLIVYRKTGPSA